MNKVNPFPALTAPFPLILLSNLFIGLEVKLLTNPGKLPPAKELEYLLELSSLNYLTKTKRSTRLNYFKYLSFTKFYIC